MLDEHPYPCTKCGKFFFFLTAGKGGYYCQDCYDHTIHNQHVYPNHPQFNGNACITPEGINIYDHLDSNLQIDWSTVNRAVVERFRGTVHDRPHHWWDCFFNEFYE